MRRILSILFGLVLLVGGVVLGITLANQLSVGSSTTGDTPDKPPLGSAPVVRTDLVERRSFDASLEFADRRTIGSSLTGTVTAVPTGGNVVDIGDIFIEVDGMAVVVMRGERPMWRPLAEGVDPSADVLQLEQNLSDLGYLTDGDEPVIPDEEFDEITGDAVEQWREDRGLSEGRVVELGRIQFLTGPVRVGDVHVRPGDLIAPGVRLLDVSAPGQDVILQLPVDDRDLATVGDAVVVVLPDDVTGGGTIRSISRVVSSLPGPAEPLNVVEVIIDLDDPSLAGDLDRAPVEVELESGRAEDVLAVPVDALVALAEGGYAVQVLDGDNRRLVGVEIGTFLDTLVEITGAVAEGDLVVVPK